MRGRRSTIRVEAFERHPLRLLVVAPDRVLVHVRVEGLGKAVAAVLLDAVVDAGCVVKLLVAHVVVLVFCF